MGNYKLRLTLAMLFVVGSCVTDVILPIFTGKILDLMVEKKWD